VTYDGRAFLQSDKNIYDVILVDAFQDISPPFQMSSTEFFSLVRNHLAKSGVMVVNMNMRGDINEYLIDTIGKSFPAMKIIDARGVTNKVLFAAGEENILNGLQTRAEALDDKKLSELMLHIAKTWQEPTLGENILTDDRAPVEMLSMRALDKIISNHLEHYKEIYRREGLDGVLNSF
ncbi:MAG: fused MFS/spermidine synthase, partial [Selenomonadaceae bacterium]|nr:fused MFS/spermidine synthase [Selenomonadaceae bacterium]